eukprot:4503730-Amphidinium_carterae.1
MQRLIENSSLWECTRLVDIWGTTEVQNMCRHGGVLPLFLRSPPSISAQAKTRRSEGADFMAAPPNCI